MTSRRFAVALALISSLGCLTPPEERPSVDAGPIATGGGAAGQSTLELSPATLTLPLGTSAPLRVVLVQPGGASSDVTAAAELRAEPEGVVVVSGGQVRAVAPGVVSLVAKAQGLEARASISVPVAQVATLEVLAGETTVLRGAVVEATALVTLTDGSKVDVTQTALWSAGPQTVVEVLEVVGPGRALARFAGEGSLRAAVGAQSAHVVVTVREVPLVALVVTPGTAQVALGGTVQLSARGRYADGSEADVSRLVAWTSSGPAFSVDATGLAEATSAGSATLTATVDELSATAALTATQATATSLAFMPGSLTLGVRTSGAVRVVATYSDGSSGDVTSQVTFSSSAPAIASVSSSSAPGVVTAHSAGAAVVTARLMGLVATAPVTVTAAALQMIELTPRSLTLPSNGAVSVRARGRYSDGSQGDVTEQALWTSSDATLVSVSNGLGTKGTVRALAGGIASVTASLDGVSATLAVTVQAPTVMHLELAPTRISVDVGDTTQLRAMAWMSDQTIVDVTQQATWVSLQPQLAALSTSVRGQVRGVAMGSAAVQATFRGQMATATILVQSVAVTQLSLSPGALTVPLGLPAGFEAIAANSDGTTSSVTTQVQWSSSNPAIADILVSQGYAYLDSKQPGSVVITATMSGAAPARATVTVTAATLARLEVTPAQPTLPVGAYVELAASGIYSDLTAHYLRYLVSWTSSDPSVASVGNGTQDKGLLWGLSPGTTTITATYNGVSASTVVTVSGASLSRIEVTPFAPRLPVGFDTYLRATGIYSDNTTRDLTYLVSWTSSASSVATVGTYAYLQPLTAGTATITATAYGVQGTTTLTVTGATLTSVSVMSPSAAPLGVQETRRFTAVGTFSDGQMMDVTPYVTWLTSAAPIASVSNAYPENGAVKGLSPGMATITAIRGGVSASHGVTVQ